MSEETRHRSGGNKANMKESVFLPHSDFTKEFRLRFDASISGIAVILGQGNNDGYEIIVYL